MIYGVSARFYDQNFATIFLSDTSDSSLSGIGLAEQREVGLVNEFQLEGYINEDDL